MKKMITLFLCISMMFSFFTFSTNATNNDDLRPYIIETNLTTNPEIIKEYDVRATGLIRSYSIYLTKTGSILNLTAQTYGSAEVIKSGFKDIMVQRRKTSDDPWKDYFDYGDVYADTFFTNLDTKISVAANYQYRVTLKHYAKKNILSVQTVSNTSNIVTTV